MKSIWTRDELTILVDNYPTIGAHGVANMLPSRGISSIYNQAAARGLHSTKQTRERKRWSNDAFTDAQIKAVFERPMSLNSVRDLAARLGRPRWWVSKRAGSLGLSHQRMKEVPWSDDELEVLQDNAHKEPRAIVAMLRRRGFKRTEVSVVVKRKRIGIGLNDARNQAGIYSGRQLSILLGMDDSSMPRHIRLGRLKASRRGSERTEVQGGDFYEIKAPEIRRFIATYPELIDLRRVDKTWFIDLLAGDSIKNRCGA